MVTVCGRDDLIAERWYDLLIFRADEAGRIISGFPQARLSGAGRCVYNGEFRGSARREYIQRMLSGFSRAPFMIDAESGCALMVRSMVPVANLCAALILRISPDCVKTLAQRGVFDIVVLPPGEYGRSRRGKSEAADPRELALAGRVYRCVREGFYGFNHKDFLSDAEEIISKAFLAAGGLARIACCRCVCMADERVFGTWPLDMSRKFDGDIYAAFTLLSLIVCGRAGIRRDAKLRFGIFNGEPVIDIETEVDGSDTFPEIEECRRIADRRRLLFECSIVKNRENKNNTIKIRFIPVRYDWSVLGIKSETCLLYD